jgi:hypothetical protein
MAVLDALVQGMLGQAELVERLDPAGNVLGKFTRDHYRNERYLR